MKRCKAKYGNRYCSFEPCLGHKVLAVYMESGISGRLNACENHKDDLAAQEKRDDGHMSLADEMTWGRL